MRSFCVTSLLITLTVFVLRSSALLFLEESASVCSRLGLEMAAQQNQARAQQNLARRLAQVAERHADHCWAGAEGARPVAHT